MEEIRNKIKQINQDYTFLDYLKYNREIGKCIILITDSQAVFLPAVLGFKKDHCQLLESVLLSIGFNNTYTQDNYILLSAVQNKLSISFPPNKISLNQIALMESIFCDIDVYNDFIRQNIGGDFSLFEAHFFDFNKEKDLIELRDYLFHNLSFDKVCTKEIIVGKVPSKDEISHVLKEVEYRNMYSKNIIPDVGQRKN